MCQFSNGCSVAGTKIGAVLPIHGTLICSHLWMSTRSLAVYPPMSHWVFALTFLRATSQGVDAVFLLLDWVFALMDWLLRLIRASVCLGVSSSIQASKLNYRV